MKIVEREALYVRQEDLKPKVRKALIDSYTFRFYNDKACNSCEYMVERHSDICDNCNAFLGEVQLASPIIVNNKKYIKFPAGAKDKLEKQIVKHTKEKPKFVNRQVTVDGAPMRRKIRFKYKLLKDYQRPAIKAMIDVKKGVLKSAPRTGKTVMMAAAICKLNGKTLILAAQRTWLEGFYETFCGSKTQKRFSDAKGAGVSTQEISAWRKAGRPHRSVGFAKTYEDFLKLDVCLVTYQTFISEGGQKLLERISGLFSVLSVDEVHTANAERFAHTVAAIRSQYKLGLSGTPQRKDRREVIIRHLFGEILHETVVEQMRPRIVVTKTNFIYKAKQPRWDQIISSMENNAKRLRLIAETAVKDAKAGHMVLIPLYRVTAQRALTMAINKIAGKTIAAVFNGEVDKDRRSKLVQLARDYKLKILVGNIKMLSTGINIPRASCLYEVTASSNLPGAEQRFKRVLTKYDDKPPPTIRYFLDDSGVRRNCMRNEYWNCLIPICKPILDTKTKEIMNQYFSGKQGQGRLEI